MLKGFLHLDLLSVGIASAAIAVLGFTVFLNDRKSATHRIFFVLSLLTVIWSAFNYSIYQSTNPNVAIWLLRIATFFALWYAFATFLFAFIFPATVMPVFPRWIKIFAIPITCITSILLLTPFIFTRALSFDNGRLAEVQNGPAIPLFGLLSIFFVIAGLILLFKKARRARGIERRQITYIFIGSFITYELIIIFNLIFPIVLKDSRFITLGAVFVFPFIVFTAYAIIKHHLLHIKVIATEILSFLLLVTSFFEVVLSDTIWKIVFRIFLFSALLVVSFFLIRSVRKEVEQREKLQILTGQLELANKELSRLDQAKSEFLSIASHQLRTPLTAIKGYSSMLLDGTFGPIGGKIKEGVEKVYASTERMVALVNDLLDTSRLDSGRMVFTFVETDLGEVAKSVCDELMPKGKEKGLVIACAVAPATSKVFVDQMKIRQVLVNFVDNALKYSDTGTVEVKLEQKNDEVVFSVHDNGWGMTPEEMGFLFKKFSRGRGDTSQIKGTGLGLYVARRLAEAHGGRVWAESPGKGQGSTFLLALKLGWKPSADGVYMPKEE
ncbi:MAG: ATP-binding protein [bacterium]|nr:ATP-binding protein [bacterium]